MGHPMSYCLGQELMCHQSPPPPPSGLLASTAETMATVSKGCVSLAGMECMRMDTKDCRTRLQGLKTATVLPPSTAEIIPIHPMLAPERSRVAKMGKVAPSSQALTVEAHIVVRQDGRAVPLG